MNKLNIIVNTAAGIESVTKRELSELGYPDTKAIDGRISLNGDYNTVATLNIGLRTADRVLIEIAAFSANTFDELFDGVKSAPIEDYLPSNAKILIRAKSVKSALFALSAIQSITKKAVVERLRKAYKIIDIVETGEEYTLELSVIKDLAVLTLDTSGAGLHKRGYRDKVWTAPLKETLAAAIIKLSVWNPDRPLIDPFCGSGTIPIEAALIANKVAPGLYRQFSFEKFNDTCINAARIAREKAQDTIDNLKQIKIYGYDIDYKAIRLSLYHAERAKVKVHFEKRAMQDVTSLIPYGVIITNPPYGERLLNEKELKALLRDFNKMYMSLDNWCLYALSASDRFEEYFDAPSIKNRKLYNGGIECRLYTYLKDKPKDKIIK